jgi:hypothetical protein
VPSENLGACGAPMAARLNITLRGQNGVSPNCCRSLKMLWSIAGCLFGMLLLRRKILPALPPDRKASAVRPPDPNFPYLRLGVIAAAIIIAALFSVLGRPGTEKVESPKAVAIATRPSIISPSSAPPQKLASLESNPPETLSQETAVPGTTTKDLGVQIDPRKLMNLMNAGVAKYASESDDANKAKGAFGSITGQSFRLRQGKWADRSRTGRACPGLLGLKPPAFTISHQERIIGPG